MNRTGTACSIQYHDDRHYDHLGNYNGFVYIGADDNASGTVAMMTIAKACMAADIKPQRTIIKLGFLSIWEIANGEGVKP